MRYRVFNETQLTCSVGLGPKTMLAKVASDVNKPNGQYVLPDDPTAVKECVESLSLRKVPGIGKVCSTHVGTHSCRTCTCALNTVSVILLPSVAAISAVSPKNTRAGRHTACHTCNAGWVYF